MKLSIDWITGAGCLAVIATLALSVPGVRVVRADDEVEVISVEMVGSAPSCQAGAAESRQKTVGVVLKRDPSQPGDSRTIALNNRGYTYHAPAVDPELRADESR